MKQPLAVIIGISALTSTVLLAGCSAPNLPGIYRMDIQQGNVITADMLTRLEPRMTKRKVRFVLGTPLISDPFNDNRWDYVYTRQTRALRRKRRACHRPLAMHRLPRLQMRATAHRAFGNA